MIGKQHILFSNIKIEKTQQIEYSEPGESFLHLILLKYLIIHTFYILFFCDYFGGWYLVHLLLGLQLW